MLDQKTPKSEIVAGLLTVYLLHLWVAWNVFKDMVRLSDDGYVPIEDASMTLSKVALVPFSVMLEVLLILLIVHVTFAIIYMLVLVRLEGSAGANADILSTAVAAVTSLPKVTLRGILERGLHVLPLSGHLVRAIIPSVFAAVASSLVTLLFLWTTGRSKRIRDVDLVVSFAVYASCVTLAFGLAVVVTTMT